MKIKKATSLILTICLVLALQPVNLRPAFAAVNELNSALNVPGGTLSFSNDSQNPWVTDSTSTPGRTSAASNIAGVSNGITTVTLNAGQLQKNKVLQFDWKVSSEAERDYLFFIVNDTPYQPGAGSPYTAPISGAVGDWAVFRFIVPESRSYTFKWTYMKDNAVNSGADTAWLDNVKISDPVPVDSVIVTPAVSSAYINFTTQFSASVIPADATEQRVTWSSTNTAVATVDSNGVVTGKSQGSAYIVATPVDAMGASGESIVNVAAPVPTTGVSLNYKDGKLLVGATGTLVATITPEFATYRTITWSSTNNSVATVTTAGVVRGISAGNAHIRAQTETGGFLDSCAVNVVEESSLGNETSLTPAQVVVDSVTPTSLGWNLSQYIRYSRPPLTTTTTARMFQVNLEAGKKISFETRGTTAVDTYLDLYDSNGNRLAFDDDEGQASYSLIESFMVPHTGTYRLLVSGYTFSSSGSFNLHISEVPPIPVTGVQFNQDTFSVPLGYTLPVPYAILPGDADIQGVTFSSSNESSIAVNAGGEVTGVSPGSSVITVTTNQGGFTDTCLVSVGYTPVSSVRFGTDAVIVGVNKTKTLQYTIEPAAAQLKGVIFTSNNQSVATVSTSGIVTAVGLGNAVITVTTADGGKTDTCSVKVVAVNISTSASVTLVAGDVWGDGTGYQLLLDADADAYGRLFQKSGALNDSGNVPDSVYNQFEYKIPENANGVLTTPNIVVNNSITILIPAGVYDYCIANPVPNKKVWIADTNVTSPGRYNNFHFEAGYSYTFVMTSNNSPIPSFLRDVTTLTASYTGAGLSKYNVNFSVPGTGGSLSGKTQLLTEEGYTLTAADIPIPVPAPGYHFTGWNAEPLGMTLNADISFIATFAINTYNVTFKDWNNAVLKFQENVAHGSAATPPASPNSKPDWTFVGWSPDYSVITGTVTIIAQYAINSFAINLPSGEGFAVSLHGQSVNPVPLGGRFTFTVTLSPNYSNSTIVIKSNGATLTPVLGVYTIDNVTEIKTVTITGVVLNNADYTALDAAIALSPIYSDAYYTDTTINAFRNAQTAAQGIARDLNILSQPDIDAAQATVVTAYHALVLKAASYTLLDTALLLSPLYDDIYYTEDTIVIFRSAITAGQGVSRSLNITQQATVDNAVSAISSAHANLVLKPDQTLFILNSTSTLVINRVNNSLAGLSLQSNSVADILDQFDNSAIITVFDINGVQLDAGQLIGTGSVIELLSKEGTVVDSVTVILYGDTDGNGLADGMDATLVSLIAAGMLTQMQVGEFVWAAADVNRDGQIDSLDAMLLEQAGLFMITLS